MYYLFYVNQKISQDHQCYLKLCKLAINYNAIFVSLAKINCIYVIYPKVLLNACDLTEFCMNTK